jgi:hypothetical protein
LRSLARLLAGLPPICVECARHFPDPCRVLRSAYNPLLRLEPVHAPAW